MHIILDMARRTSTVTFTVAELDWLSSKELSVSAATAYRGEVGRLATYCAALGIMEISRIHPENWISYIASLSTDRTAISENHKPLKPSSARQAIRITRAFLLHCAQRKWIHWDPRETTVSAPVCPVPARTSSLKATLSHPLRRVLSGELIAIDEREARRHFALGLGFWGALSPRELAHLKVRDLRISSTTGEGELICRSRPHPVLFPAELGKLWLRYRDSRQKESLQKIKPTSALIANLKNGNPLCAWSIWALMHESRGKSNATDDAINPRLLRLAYAESTSENALGEIAIIQGQIGKNLNEPRKRMAQIRRHTLSALHEATLKKLRAAL